MRSSIACARCRRSKIKCVNAGIDTTCRACESSGRECVYPTPTIGGAGGATKRDYGALVDGDDRHVEPDGPKRQRPRKSITVSAATKDPTKPNVDVLDSSILTVKAWETIFELFQFHYATLLPFLHPATLLNQIRQISASDSSTGRRNSQEDPSFTRSDPSPLVLLGVLALTARFHPQLVAYHSPSSAGSASNPLLASEFYAKALRSRLAGADAANLASPELTRVQAFLMLALHEWGMCRTKSAWVYVGLAIRLSQAMGLPFELENGYLSRDSQQLVSKPDMDHFGVTRPSERREHTSDDVIFQETKRRTFWACFVLDRCLSAGKYRPRMIQANDLNIQLPSDNAFAFGERVRTSRLNEPGGRHAQSFGCSQGMQIPSIRHSLGLGDDKLAHTGPQDPKSWSPVSRRKDSGDEDIERWEIGPEEPVLGRVIRVIRIWGSIVKWACAGGRRTEQCPPWHPDSQFTRLRSMLADFQDLLSRNLQYSIRNTDTHITYKHALAPYTVMHSVYFLSVMALHRAYLPFLPLRCSEPIGPLDDPIFSSDRVNAPEGFWQESAKELFKAARQMTDLAVTCQERGVLVENSLIGFAIYNAALVGLYAIHFPHMDQDGYLRGSRPAPGETNQDQAQTRKALNIVRDLRHRLKMAVGWFRTLNRLHSYYSKCRKEWVRCGMRKPEIKQWDLGDLHTNCVRPMRDDDTVGCSDDCRQLDKLFLAFGNMADQLSENSGDEENIAAPESHPDHVANGSDAGSGIIKCEPAEGREPPPHRPSLMLEGRRESWISVNGSSGLPLPGPGPGPGSDGERRPSLPLPPGRSLQSPSYPLPPLHHHHPDNPYFGNNNNLPSPKLRTALTSSTSSYGSPPASQPPPPHYLPPSGTRLQPLNSWLTSRQHPPPPPPPSYTQSLPPINASQHLPMLPLPAPGNYGVTSPPATTDSSDNSHSHGHHLLNNVCLGGDDLMGFLDGCDCDQWPSMGGASEVGIPTGWLSTVWTDFGR